MNKTIHGRPNLLKMSKKILKNFKSLDLKTKFDLLGKFQQEMYKKELVIAEAYKSKIVSKINSVDWELGKVYDRYEFTGEKDWNFDVTFYFSYKSGHGNMKIDFVNNIKENVKTVSLVMAWHNMINNSYELKFLTETEAFELLGLSTEELKNKAVEIINESIIKKQ